MTLAQPAAWAADFVGLPFAEHGRDENGVDCYGLLHFVFERALGQALPPLTANYSSTEDHTGIEVAAEERHEDTWRKVAVGQAKNFDVLFFRPARVPLHVGLFVEPGFMLHVEKDVHATCVSFHNSTWAARLEGVYRHFSQA